ncbi:DUF4376 domain-containing protein [Nisaea nitritireducens]|uniref:DUF4376 domain-containing protein n=1 Tax=Nisaea nitritireducens TaxID=568392 RepID=UPI001866B044|nr:DUF4376 domain-containing protein [Nisaea nitritireducens]
MTLKLVTGVPVSLSAEETATRAAEYLANFPKRKEDLCDKIDAEFKKRIAAGFSYAIPHVDPDPANPEYVYDIDDAAQANMLAIEADFLGGAVDAHDGYWRAADNQNIVFTDDEVRIMFRAAKAYKMALIRAAHALKSACRAATDDVELDAIDITVGWLS